MKRPCLHCKKKPAKYRRPGTNKHVSDAEHDLCPRCANALENSAHAKIRVMSERDEERYKLEGARLVLEALVRAGTLDEKVAGKSVLEIKGVRIYPPERQP